jgi:ribosomal protein S20
MPITTSARKAVRQSRRKEKINSKTKRRLSLSIKSFERSPKDGDLPAVYKIIDLAAKKNLIHPNRASRIKSRLSKLASAKNDKPKTSVKSKKTTSKKQKRGRMANKKA